MPKSNFPTIRIHDLETGEVIDREMTEDEFSQYQSEAEIKAKVKAEEETKSTARQAIAERLGLTADELQVLLG